MSFPYHYIEIHWSCGHIEEARQISHMLIEKRLVACAQIISNVESIFSWKDKIETVKEVVVIFKTHKNLFNKVKEFIIAHAEYEVPQILEVAILSGNEDYLCWMAESLL